MKKMIDKLKNSDFAKAGVWIFLIITAISTWSAAKIDNGSWTNPNPLTDGGHYMTMGESIVFNIPLGISDGIVAVLMFALLTMIISFIKTYWENLNA